PVGFDGRERMDGVYLARLERGDPGGLVEDDSELDGLDLWSAGPVAIERLEDKPLTGHPLDELVRPRAHRMQRERLVTPGRVVSILRVDANQSVRERGQ